MEVHFTPEQETQLAQIASKAGTDAEHLVRDAALRLLEDAASSKLCNGVKMRSSAASISRMSRSVSG
jgi:hypothetical protein